MSALSLVMPPDFDEELEWSTWAACKDLPVRVFFLKRGQDADLARNICATCPVRAPCLAYALANGELTGVWGGFTHRELRLLRDELGLSGDEPEHLRRSREDDD